MDISGTTMTIESYSAAVARTGLSIFPQDSFIDSRSATPTSSHPTANKSEDGPEYSYQKGDGQRVMYYNLRERDGKHACVTWLDNDDSGDWDPKTDGKLDKGKIIRRRIPVRRAVDENVELGEGETAGSYKTFRLSSLAAAQNGVSMVVSLQLASQEGKALIAKIPDNWPVKKHNVLSDDYIAKIAKEIQEMRGDPTSEGKQYNFRNRMASTQDDTTLLAKHGIPDPAGIHDNLTNHPAARGCVACRKLELPCPLLLDDSTWPCHVCIEDDQECELITPPTKKTICEPCKRKKLPCSYAEGSDPKLPCTNCNFTGSKCVAGPAAGAMRARISYDKDYTRKLDPQKRQHVTCFGCRTGKLSCSLRSKLDSPPCNHCIEEGVACTFQTIRTKPKKVQKASVSKPRLKASSGTPENTIVIKTALCHPITFLAPDPEDCHWCTNPSYGIIGLGWVDVLVRPSTNNLEYQELREGHASTGHVPSKMCVTCTMSRVRIVGCPEHEMRPLDGLITRALAESSELLSSNDMELDNIDVEAAFDRLMSSTLLPTDKWCQLCPSLALYQCCTPQETDMWGEQIEDPSSDDAQGCGLMLCEDCAVVMTEEEDLEDVIDAMAGEDAEERWAMGMRADTEFLRKEGLLVRQVFQGMGDLEGMELDA